MKRSYLLAALLIALTTACLCQTNGRIFYSSFSPQDWDVYLSLDHGENFEQFTHHPSLDYDAVISPDGKWVVFTSERSGTPQLYIKSITGQDDSKPLVSGNSFQDQAAFSSDGTAFAFVSSHEGNADIYVLPFRSDSIQDIANARNLTNHPGGDFRPAFSPDGDRIAFSSDRGHAIVPHPRFSFARQRTGDIYRTNSDGTGVLRLTDSDSWDGSPKWSADGTEIYFYSERQGQNSIFSMNGDGSDQRQVITFSGPAVSPEPSSDGTLTFTTWNGEQDFRIMKVDRDTVVPLTEEGPELMFNLDAHPNGLMVFHGGAFAKSPESTRDFGFEGSVLSIRPDTITVAGRSTNIYGVRRPFVAPPQPGNTRLLYDVSVNRTPTDFITPFGYTLFLLPAIVIILIVFGIIMAIKHRKTIPVWRYLLFTFVVLLTGILVGGLFVFLTVIELRPVNTIRTLMSIVALVFALLGWWFYRKRFRSANSSDKGVSVSSSYAALFLGIATFSLLCAGFLPLFVDNPLHFYTVDYQTGARDKIFELYRENNTHPANFSVLDSKVTHDGNAFVFTTGSFRSKPHGQGDIWRYDFATKTPRKISDSPYNDGFADFSEDGTMVFRSGRSGSFDIYLKSADTTLNLTNDVHRDNFPAISKAGDLIVFASDRLTQNDDYQTMDIFLIRRGGDNSWSEPEKISTGQGQNAHPHFSPNGEWIIYATEAYGINDEQPLIQPIIFSPQMYGEIVAYNLNSREHVRITDNKWEEGAPLWVE